MTSKVVADSTVWQVVAMITLFQGAYQDVNLYQPYLIPTTKNDKQQCQLPHPFFI